MKIVLATHHFLPNYTAGAELYAYRVARWLHSQGHAVEVVCIESVTNGTTKPTSEPDTYEGLLVHRLHLDLSQAPEPFRWSFRNPEIGSWFDSFLRDTRPDLMHINSCYLLSATVLQVAYEVGIPTVLTLHDYWFLCPLITLLRRDGSICRHPVEAIRCVWCLLSAKRRYRMPDRALRGRLGDAFTKIGRSEIVAKAIGLMPQIAAMEERRSFLKQALGMVDVAICPSRFLMDKVAAYGFQPRRMVYLPFGLENVAPLSNQPNERREKLRIGYLGQIAPRKGVDLLLMAFKKLRPKPGECELIIYGHVASASSYGRKLLRIAGDHPFITFAGPYPNSEVGRVLNSVDIVVVPSVWYENRPTVIIEAFAYRTPVIASDLGGMAELVRDGENGLLFAPGDANDLARQLQRLLDDPRLLPTLRAGIGPVKSVAQEMDELEEIYRVVAGNGRPRPEELSP